jgi:hypothetical protein
MAANQARARLGRQSGRHDRVVRTPFGHQQPCPGSCTRSSRSPSVRRGCFPATGLAPYFGRVCTGACIRRAPSCRRGLSRTCVRSLGLGRRDGQGCADEREVAERLREVADLPLPRHVVLLGQQAEIVCHREEPLEERAGLRDAAVERERADQPERAGQELSFVTGQSVVGLRGRVAGYEAVAAELA